VSHTCHAINCATGVPPRMWGCRRHWAMVPALLQRKLQKAYRPGQERRMDPSAAYLRAAAECVATVARAEGMADAEIKQCPEYSGYLAWADMLETSP
jgi:hypothetical protein